MKIFSRRFSCPNSCDQGQLLIFDKLDTFLASFRLSVSFALTHLVNFSIFLKGYKKSHDIYY